jgi:hypothetical protein
VSGLVQTVPLFTEDEAKSVANHQMFHKMGMCICPCYDLLIRTIESLPERDRAVAIEATLKAFQTLDAAESG